MTALHGNNIQFTTGVKKKLPHRVVHQFPSGEGSGSV